jgi:hypothetical protein
LPGIDPPAVAGVLSIPAGWVCCRLQR